MNQKETVSLTEEDIKKLANELYKLQRRDELVEKDSLYCDGWIKLRKEINDWIHSNINRSEYSYSSLQMQIYGAVKFVTGCKGGLREMTNEQSKGARWIFEQMKDGFEKYGTNQKRREIK